MTLMPTSSLHGRQIVLLHGLGRTRFSMAPVEWALRARGARVLNLGYPSRRADAVTLARAIGTRIHLWCGPQPIDAVTHSLGGLLVRLMVAQRILPLKHMGRVVMLGTPNGGSELSDRLPKLPVLGPLYARLTGPVGRALGTDEGGLAAQLPPVAFETGIIAGTRSWNPFFSRLIGGENDGKVRVERARVAGMRDFLTVPQWHPILMLDPRVLRQVIAFLERGSFSR
jgi:hypothetical protein